MIMILLRCAGVWNVERSNLVSVTVFLLFQFLNNILIDFSLVFHSFIVVRSRYLIFSLTLTFYIIYLTLRYHFRRNEPLARDWIELLLYWVED